MKTYQRRKIQIATLLLMLTFVFSFVCGCFVEPTQYQANSSGITVTNITDQVNSQVEQLALTSQEEASIYGKDDSCWVIVRFNDDSILDTAMKTDSSDVYAYINSSAALKQASSINKAHDKFARKYSSVIEATSYRYNALFNGMAIQIRYGDIAKLKKDSSVRDVILCERYNKPDAVTQNEVNVYDTGIYNPGDVGFDGTGTVVAVLDTGLDYTHTAFQEMPTGNLAIDIDRVRSLLSSLTATTMSAGVGSELTADALYVSDKVPFAYDYADIDPDVYPTEDHGTHVAGIIAGHDDVITGIATNAQLAIMKVFNDVDVGAPQEAILAALNDCVVLGVDAINMSLGSSCGFSRESDNDRINEIYDSIRQAGICLICAASNDYASSYQSTNGDMSLATNPDYGTVGSPSSYEASMSVASISGVKTKYLMLNSEMEVYFTEAGNTGSTKHDFASEMLALKGGSSAEFEYVVIPGLGSVSNYYGLDVKGKIAVIKRGSLNFEDKIINAQNQGAIGAIIYNNVSGVITMSIGKAKIPACSVSMDAGKYFEAHTTGTLVIDETYAAGPFMSEFSSWGPLPNLEFKPDITAHGGDIYSAVRGGYDHFSGTSMAAPNMAGATILVRQYVKENFPELSAYEVTELTYQLLMSTATIAYNEEGNPYSPRKQGAGLADIGKSTTASAYLYVEGTNKPKLSLGDDPTKTGEYELVFNIKNLSSMAQSYVINPIVMTESMSSDNKTVAQKAHMFNDTAYSASVDGKGAKLNGNNSLSLEGYAVAQLTIKLTLSDAAKKYLDITFANGMYVEGYIQLLSQNNDVDLNIGFLGFYGDWSVAPMLDVTAFEVGAEQEDMSILDDDKLKADVYATLPMSGFRYLISSTDYEESYYGMAQFGYKIADGYTEPAIIEDKASLTANMSGSYSLKYIAAGLLRNAKTVKMQISNAVTGEVIWEAVDYDIRKSYFSGARRPGMVTVDFYVNDYNLANNSRYTFSMECELDWASTANNTKNTFSFDFYIDNEAPIIVKDRTQVRVEGTGTNKRYYLDVYAYDNHYIQGYQLGTFGSINADGSLTDSLSFHNGLIPMTDGNRNSENRISYDITQYWNEIQQRNGNIYVELIDYAKNRSSFRIQLPSSNAEELKFKNTMQRVNTYVNEVVDLKDYLTTTPNNLWVKDLKWWIVDDEGYENVAIVRDGVVLGLNEGTAILYVSNADESAIASLPVTIRAERNKTVNLTQIQLNKTSNTIERGEQFTLSATLMPHDLFADIVNDKLSNVNLTWSTAGGYVKFVTYDEQGNEVLVDRVVGETSVIVRSLRSGSATVNVIDSNSTSRVNSSCTIRIKNEYEVDGGYLKSYTGRGDEKGVVEIPDDLGIAYIYPQAFFNNKYITKIIIPDGVTTIMEAAIYGCDNLTEVVLPKSCKTLEKWSIAWNPKLETIDLGGVNTIGEMTFISDSSLKNIDFSGVFSIGPRSFMYCDSLNVVDISHINSMGEYAFAYCAGLTGIITGQYTPIGDYAFYACDGLTEIELNGRAIGEFAFAYCDNLQSVTINKALDTIGYAAFYYCTSLSEVNYRSTVRVIDDYAFVGCAFETIVIPNGVERLGSVAYGGNDNAREVLISAGAKLTTIGTATFQLCDNIEAFTVEEGNAYLSTDSNGILYDKAKHKIVLVPNGYDNTELTLPDTVTEIGSYAFSYSNIESVTGENVVKINDGAFYSSAIKSVSFSDKLSYIGSLAFYDTENFAWQDCFNNANYIGDYAFAISTDSTFTKTAGVRGNLNLPNITHIGNYAFANTKISGITLGSNLRTIGNYAFVQCSNLSNVSLSDGLVSVGNYAFAYCTALKTITIPNTVTNLGVGAFYYCTGLRSVNLSNNDKFDTIAAYTFSNCNSLSSLTLPNNIKYIGECAFMRLNESVAGALTNINLDNIESVGEYAFTNTQLTSLNAPKLKQIGEYAFGYTKITQAFLPEVTVIEDHAFEGCVSLTAIQIPKAEKVGAFAFFNCTGLSAIDLTSVKELGDVALAGASKLASVTLGKLKTLGQSAFAGTLLTTVHLPASLEQIATSAFGDCIVQTNGRLWLCESHFETITVDEANPLFFTDNDGVLYKRLSNGLLSLVYYPTYNYTGGIYRTSYTALEKTVKVEPYAFAGNTTLAYIVLPERLQVLGAGAFYGCLGLMTLELRCVQAPTLEMIYDETNGGIENHYYNIFQNNSSTTSTVVIIYPINGSGYDAYNWQLYLKDNLFAGGAIARTQTTIDTADALSSLDINSLTLDDVARIVLLRRIYTSLPNEQKNFLVSVSNKLSQAESQLAYLLIKEIANLPKKVTATDKAEVERLRRIYNQCNSQIQSEVTNLSKLTAAEEQLSKLSGGDTEGNSNWMLPTFVSIGVVLVLVAGAVVTVFMLKRKKAQATVATEEGTNNEEK